MPVRPVRDADGAPFVWTDLLCDGPVLVGARATVVGQAVLA